jgi:hypothetical protein
MLLQDQARAIAQNVKNTDNKKKALEEAGGTFRAPVTLTKMKKRNFEATYGDPQKADRISAGRVFTAGGESYPLKQVKVVPLNAARVPKSAPPLRLFR